MHNKDHTLFKTIHTLERFNEEENRVGGKDVRERGFTFVELMIAVAIVGVLALFSVPMFRDMMPAVRVNAAARELATEMQSARMWAVTKRADYRVAFDITNHTFTLCTDRNADGSITCTAGDPDVVKTVAIQEKYQNTVVFGPASGVVGPPGSASPAPITSAVTFVDDYASFKPFGTAKPGTVYLIPSADLAAGRKDRIRAITVVSSTGRVKLWKCDASCNTAGSWSAS